MAVTEGCEIGELARCTVLAVSAFRYYEAQGLIPLGAMQVVSDDISAPISGG